MKTIKQVESDIIAAKEELTFIRKTDGKGENSVSGKIKSMRLAKNYLEFNPTLESCTRQKEEVTNYIAIVDNRFEEYKKLNYKIVVTREMFYDAKDIDKKELSKWKSELKFLNYILA